VVSNLQAKAQPGSHTTSISSCPRPAAAAGTAISLARSTSIDGPADAYAKRQVIQHSTSPDVAKRLKGRAGCHLGGSSHRPEGTPCRRCRAGDRIGVNRPAVRTLGPRASRRACNTHILLSQARARRPRSQGVSFNAVWMGGASPSLSWSRSCRVVLNVSITSEFTRASQRCCQPASRHVPGRCRLLPRSISVVYVHIADRNV